VTLNRHFTITPLDASFGAKITDLDLATITADKFNALYETWLEYALLVFPGQHLSHQAQVAFAKRFGDLEFDLAAISNVKRDGSIRSADGSDDVIKVLKGNMGWHADSTYMPVQAKGAVFTAHVVPDQGGQTGWADMCAAYEALDDILRQQVHNLSAYHSLHYSQAQINASPNKNGSYSGYGLHDLPPPLRPLVKVHPETGRPALLIGRHAFGIPGLSDEASKALLDELVDIACQAPRVYYHQWTAGDAVVWDNRCLLHRGCPWNMQEPRVMYHSRIGGDPVSETAATTR
jgi:alpha-ketoglutarate-dependent taurine dioxygenase